MLALGPQKLAQLWEADNMAGKTKGEGCHFGAVIMGPMQVDGNKQPSVSGRRDSHWVRREGRAVEKVPDDILSPMRPGCLSSTWSGRLSFLELFPILLALL